MKHFKDIDFYSRVEEIKKELAEKVLSEVNFGGGKFLPEDLRFHFEFWLGDSRIDNIKHSSIKEFVLKDDEPSVYKVVRRSVISGRDEVIITVLFEFDEIIYVNKDVLGIGDDTYTFDHYRDFLKFLESTLCKEDNTNRRVSVSLSDRKTSISLLWLFESPLAKKNGLNIHPVKLTNLQSYQTLSDKDKRQVDEVLCPIKLDKDSVVYSCGIHYVSIMVDKADLVKEYFLTNVWDEFIEKKLSKPVDKVDLI